MKNKNSLVRKLSLIVGLLLIIVGIVILLLPKISKENIQKTSNEVIQQIEKEVTPEDLEVNLETPATYEFQEVKSIGLTETLAALNGVKPNYNQLIGQIVIPSLKINLPVFNGLSNNNLLSGVSTMKPNQIMGQANYTLAGHYVTGGNYLFTNLVDIKEGAIVKITNKKQIFEYKVYKTEKVPSTALYLLDDKIATERGKPIITLMSCYYYGNNDVRWFAFGELINTYDYSKEKMESLN